MFEYTKNILKKVSFNEELFRRELIKALHILLPNEVQLLKIWVYKFIKKNPHLQHTLLFI